MDRTDDYERLGEDAADAFEAVRADLSGCRVLLVPGFLSSLLRPWQRFWFADYFVSQQRWLAGEGVDCRYLRTRSQQPIAVTGPFLARQILSSDKPVIAITHSKGGIDLLHGLIEDPAARQNLRAWIPMQAPFLGTALAAAPPGDDAKSRRLLMRLIGGDYTALREMAPDARMRYCLDRRADIAAVLGEVPCLCLTSRIAKLEDIGFFLRRPFSVLQSQGYISDGIVPHNAMRLANAPFVDLPGVDHGMTVISTFSPPFDKVAMTKRLLAMVLADAP